MDAKEKWQVTRIAKKIYADDFSEDDVFILLILLRSVASSGSSLREFGDFIAHRQKDRGFLFDYMVEVKAALDRTPPFEGEITIRPVFTVDELSLQINLIFEKVGLQPFTGYQTNHVMICIISLLQAVDIKNSQGPVGSLHVALTNEQINLVGRIHCPAYDTQIDFVALSAKNDVFDSPIPIPDGKAFLSLNGVSWARTIDGRFSFNQHSTTYHG